MFRLILLNLILIMAIGTNTTTTVNTDTNTCKIPVPIVPPEDVYTYVAVKGSFQAQYCSIFGLNQEEIHALPKRFANGLTKIINGIMIKASPIDAINALSQRAYKVISSTGETEIVWTLQREV